MIEARRLFSSDECSRRSPELHNWLKDRPAMFLAPDEAVQVRVAYIVNTYRTLVAQGKEKFTADPFLIAKAQVHMRVPFPARAEMNREALLSPWKNS